MSLDYAIRIEKLSAEDGGGYLATVPDLPGCMSDGETPEEALNNIQDAIPTPMPSPVRCPWPCSKS